MLARKWALVTGANRGIGRAIAHLFAVNHANLLLNSRDQAKGSELCAELRTRYQIQAEPICFDVADPDQVKMAFQKIIKATKQLDIVVNNAGILDNNLLGMIKASTVQQVFATNTFGTIYVMQYAARLMMTHKSGSIINLSSIVGVNGNEGQVAYSGSKAAIIGITRSAAKELAQYNIRVNAIAPGFIETDMTRTLPKDVFKERLDSIKMNRIGTPEDVARTALYLASDLSEYVTGQIIGVDGGMLI